MAFQKNHLKLTFEGLLFLPSPVMSSRTSVILTAWKQLKKGRLCLLSTHDYDGTHLQTLRERLSLPTTKAIQAFSISAFLSSSLESFGHFERHHFSDSRLVIKATFSQKVSFFQSFCNVTTSFDYNYKKYVPRPSKSPQSIKYPKYSLWMWSSFVTLIQFTFPYIIPNT